jgi:hypothetical protein
MQSAETFGSSASHDSDTSGVRVVLLLDPDLARRVEDWRRAQGVIPTRTDAIRFHLSRSLAAEHATA